MFNLQSFDFLGAALSCKVFTLRPTLDILTYLLRLLRGDKFPSLHSIINSWRS